MREKWGENREKEGNAWGRENSWGEISPFSFLGKKIVSLREDINILSLIFWGSFSKDV